MADSQGGQGWSTHGRSSTQLSTDHKPCSHHIRCTSVVCVYSPDYGVRFVVVGCTYMYVHECMHSTVTLARDSVMCIVDVCDMDMYMYMYRTCSMCMYVDYIMYVYVFVTCMYMYVVRVTCVHVQSSRVLWWCLGRAGVYGVDTYVASMVQILTRSSLRTTRLLKSHHKPLISTSAHLIL